MPINRKHTEKTPHTSNGIAPDANFVKKAQKLTVGWSPILQGCLALATGAFLFLFSLGYFEFFKLAGLALTAWGIYKSKLIAIVTNWVEKLTNRYNMKRVSPMQRIMMCFATFILVGLSLHIEAYIISGYRITIKDLGTNILLGDRHERYEHDMEQYDLLVKYLRSRNPGSTAINLEIEPTGIVYFQEKLPAVVPQRFPETMVLTKLRFLMAGLKESDVSKNMFFTSADLRHSRLWDVCDPPISEDVLQNYVKIALHRRKVDPNKYSFASFREDQSKILRKYNQFLRQAPTVLSPKLFTAIQDIIESRLAPALSAYDKIMDFFESLKPGNEKLSEYTIQDIIYTYAFNLLGPNVQVFPKLDPSLQEKVVNVVTNRFKKLLEKQQFFKEYSFPFINVSWMLDIFTPFLEHKEVDEQIMYAGNYHIHQTVAFLKELQEKMGDNTIVFQQEYPPNEERTVLSKEKLELLLQTNAIASRS